jgi:hypothetical protein
MDEQWSDRKLHEEYGDRIRAMIRHENEVTNYRTTWLLLSQTLLAAAAGQVSKDHPFAVLLIAAVGSLVTLPIAHELCNSFRSRKHLKGLWRSRSERGGYRENDVLPVDGGFKGNSAIGWLLPHRFLPPVIIAAWSIVFIAQFCWLCKHGYFVL